MKMCLSIVLPGSEIITGIPDGRNLQLQKPSDMKISWSFRTIVHKVCPFAGGGQEYLGSCVRGFLILTPSKSP